MAALDLKRCPFCGGEPRTGEESEGRPTVSCNGCGVTMAAYTEDAAIEKWNARAEQESGAQ